MMLASPSWAGAPVCPSCAPFTRGGTMRITHIDEKFEEILRACLRERQLAKLRAYYGPLLDAEPMGG